MASRQLATEMSRHGFNSTSLEVVPIFIPNFLLANMFIKIDDLAAIAIQENKFSQAIYDEWKNSFAVVGDSKTSIGLLNMFATKALV